MRQAGLFGLSNQLKRLSDCGDPLETMGRVVDFEVFRPALEKALAYGDGAEGGRPPYDPVAMFKGSVCSTRNTYSSFSSAYWNGATKPISGDAVTSPPPEQRGLRRRKRSAICCGWWRPEPCRPMRPKWSNGSLTSVPVNIAPPSKSRASSAS